MCSHKIILTNEHYTLITSKYSAILHLNVNLKIKVDFKCIHLINREEPRRKEIKYAIVLSQSHQCNLTLSHQPTTTSHHCLQTPHIGRSHRPYDLYIISQIKTPCCKARKFLTHGFGDNISQPDKILDKKRNNEFYLLLQGLYYYLQYI